MTGPEHYREAERLIKQAHQQQSDQGPGCGSEEVLAEAQVHATLAHTSATLFAAMIEKMPIDVDPKGDAATEWFAAIAPDELGGGAS